MAGVDEFLIEGCTVERWGGCAIDMVGCHKGEIRTSTFRGGGAGAASLGVQAKGGSSDVRILRCRFLYAGGRGVNLGGSTGVPYYRPALARMPSNEKYEAKNIEVSGCSFSGVDAPFVFAGTLGGLVSYNSVFLPGKWAVRILQETTSPGFAPCQKGVIENNLFVFDSTHWFEGGVNIGPNTAPETFRFVRNFWFCRDNPARSKPTLPSTEVSGTYGSDPIVDLSMLTVSTTGPASKVGAQAYKG